MPRRVDGVPLQLLPGNHDGATYRAWLTTLPACWRRPVHDLIHSFSFPPATREQSSKQAFLNNLCGQVIVRLKLKWQHIGCLAAALFSTAAVAADPPTSNHLQKLLARNPAAIHLSSLPREKAAACLVTAGFLGDVLVVPREQDTLAIINIGGRTHTAIVLTDEPTGSKMVVRRLSGVITVGSIKPALKCTGQAS